VSDDGVSVSVLWLHVELLEVHSEISIKKILNSTGFNMLDDLY